MSLAVLVLAAGEAKRMGEAKQLLPYKHSNLLAHCLQTVIKAQVGEVFCVLGAYYDKTSKVLKQFPSVHLVHNQRWSNGIGGSISEGVKAVLDKEPKTDHVMMVLVDQPLIDLEHLKGLATAIVEKPDFILATQYANGPGVPAIFPRELFDKLIQMPSKTGAKKLIEQYPKIETLSIDKERLFDVDTPADFETLQQQNASHKNTT